MAKRRHPSGSGDTNQSGTVKKRLKWNNRLRHNGPQFPPEYRRIPEEHQPLFRYQRRAMRLSKNAEEVAVFYAKFLMRKNKDRGQLKRIQRNFFEDWRRYMTPEEQGLITNFSSCDFTGIVEYLEEESERKAELNKKKSSEQRRREREEKQREAQRFKRVFVDEREEEISNYMVEPPGLFIGRGNSERIGRVKPRIRPEDVTINCDENSVPRGNWKAVVHDRSATWLAKWDDPITGKAKYIQLDAGSRFKAENDEQKYNKAEELSNSVRAIRARYMRDLRSDDLQTRQHATALYILETFALRAGNEKSKEEADTVGLCSLRGEHVRLKDGWIEFDFKGKDSIRYVNRAKVPAKVYSNLKEFQGRPKQEIFSVISTDTLNTYLNGLMVGLTAKVFRTYKATECFRLQIERLSRGLGNAELKEKKIAFDMANLEVAKLLNHRALVKNTGRRNAILKLRKKIDNMKKDLKRFRKGDDRLARAKENVRIMEKELKLKEAMDNYALQTSKVNYIDPRVVIDWCMDNDVEPERIYTRGQLKKFRWALEMHYAEYA